MTKQPYEANIKRLEELVKKLEGGDITLEQSLKAFEEGISLTRVCEAELNEAKCKIEKLVKTAGGESKTEPMES